MATAPNGTDNSGEISAAVAAAALGLVPSAPAQMSLVKVLGIVSSILGILVLVMATPLWVVAKNDETSKAATKEMKEVLAVHAVTPHEDAVSKDVYVEHVKLADERHQETKTKLENMDGKLDKLLERK